MIRAYALIGTGALAVLGLGAVPMLAQQGSSPEDGGPVLTFGIRSTLSATDNYDLRPSDSESSELFDTGLSFGYLNRRPNDTLRLDLSGVLRAVDPPRGANTFDDRTARINYNLQGVNSAISAGANYLFTSVDARDPFDRRRIFADDFLDEDDPLLEDDPIDETDLIRDRGDEERIGAQFRFQTGLNDPLGFVLEGRYFERNFTDTTDTGLFDDERFTLTGTTRVTLSPITQARVVLRYSDYSADDDPRTDRQTSSASLALTQVLSQVDTLNVSVGFEQIETDRTIGGVRQSDTENGVIGSLGLTRALTRGTIGTSLRLDRSENGETATWLVSRNLTLPRGALGLSAGVTRDVNDDIVPAGSLDFTHEMPSSTLTASLSQDVRTSARSNELRTTRASVGYNYTINPLSRIGLSANFAELARSGGPQLNDTLRADLRATYSRTLTRDWQLSTGYEFRVRDEDTVGEATSNRVFLSLERSFAIRP